MIKDFQSQAIKQGKKPLQLWKWY